MPIWDRLSLWKFLFKNKFYSTRNVIFSKFKYNVDLNTQQGDLRNSLVLLGVTLLHFAQWGSCAPPHLTHSAFLNLTVLIVLSNLKFFHDFLVNSTDQKFLIYLTQASYFIKQYSVATDM